MTAAPKPEKRQHTPGPWIAEPEYEGDDATLVHADGVTVADCGYLPKPISEANARLIAAAPNYHAAAIELDRLFLVIESAVRFADPQFRDEVVAALKANRAAIAKAEGQ